jgi:hypothetical protein
MTVALKSRFAGLRAVQAWWPARVEEVYELGRTAPVLMVMQCGDEVAGLLEPCSFRRKPFHTALTDLRADRDTLWARLGRESCRDKIRRAMRMDHRIVVDEDVDRARELVNGFIRRSGYRRPVSRFEWDEVLRHASVFMIEHGATLIAAHVLLVDKPGRARFLFGATRERTSSVEANRVIAPLNRLLHWYEMTHFKEQGFHHYDFGGVVVDGRSPLASISEFKLSFGGSVIRENIVYGSMNTVTRLLGRVAMKTWHWYRERSRREPVAG